MSDYRTLVKEAYDELSVVYSAVINDVVLSPEQLDRILGRVLCHLGGAITSLNHLAGKDELQKWDEWHNGIPAPDQDLTDLPLFSPEDEIP